MAMKENLRQMQSHDLDKLSFPEPIILKMQAQHRDMNYVYFPFIIFTCFAF